MAQNVQTTDSPSTNGNSEAIDKENVKYDMIGWKANELKRLSVFKPRSDDIMICAFPKSGTHWTWMVVRYLMAGTTDLPLTEKEDGFVEYREPEVIEAIPSPRNLNSHCTFSMLLPEYFNLRCKTIFVDRDPRDMAVSGFHHHIKLDFKKDAKGDQTNEEDSKKIKTPPTWNEFIDNFMNEKGPFMSWFDYNKDWERGIQDNPDLSFLFISYEDLKKEPLRETKRIADFLGITCSEEFLKEVVHKTSFDTMKNERINQNFTKLIDMYRKGQVGDWKNWFTVAQSERFVQVWEEKMKGTQAYSRYANLHQ